MARGTRDFGPEEKIERDRIMQVLKNIFESFGYNPIETPILERYELFSSKYGIGQESDAMRETFKLKDQGERDLVLRTEFTVPFSRFVAMNPQLRKPFKRYQIGDVFRDGPIKLGRYREFCQCDIDVVGLSDTAIDAEILQLAVTVFKTLGLEVEMRINNRKILNGILDFAGVPADQQLPAIISIDKLDKIGAEGVGRELEQRGISAAAAESILALLACSGGNKDLLAELRDKIGDNEGLEEVEKTIALIENAEDVVFTPCLARGLAYYTGNVFEVYLKNRTVLSSALAAGGRYDNMIGGFLKSDQPFPALGISFGLEAIFDALNLFRKVESKKSVVDLYIIPLDVEYLAECFTYANQFRAAGVNTDINCLPDKKLKRGMEYANSYAIPWVVIVGEDEIKENKLTLKNMQTGDQEKLSFLEAAKKINKE